MRKTKKDLIKVAILNKRLGGKSYFKLLKIALDDKASSPYDLQKAQRSAPIYWRNLQLDNYTSEIQKVLQTSAQPNTKEFLDAVYNYQKAHPETGAADALLGPITFKAMIKSNPDLFKNTDATQYNKWLSPRQIKVQLLESQKGKDIQQLVKDYGLVSLEGIAPIKNSPYAKPELKSLLEHLQSANLQIEKISEAFPPSGEHKEPAHFNGGAIDFTLVDPRLASKVVEYISNKFPQFKVLDEYNKSYGGTGGHIHVNMKNTQIS